MNEKLYPIVLLICIMLISLILAFADYIDNFIPITAVKERQECQTSPCNERQSDYYAKAIVLLSDSNNNLLHGVK